MFLSIYPKWKKTNFLQGLIKGFMKLCFGNLSQLNEHNYLMPQTVNSLFFLIIIFLQAKSLLIVLEKDPRLPEIVILHSLFLCFFIKNIIINNTRLMKFHATVQYNKLFENIHLERCCASLFIPWNCTR